MNLFFIDYNLIPLLIQENYLDSIVDKYNSKQTLEKMMKAADFISTADIINQKIRAGQNWKLLSDFANYSTILPTATVSVFCGWPKFPMWFAKNSSRKKRLREIKEIRVKMARKTYASRSSILFDYVPYLTKLLLYTMKDETAISISNTIELMKEYNLDPETLKEHLPDLNF